MKELIYQRLLLRSITDFAASEAIADGRYRATYAEHGDRVMRLSAALRDTLGVRGSDRFAVLAPNSHQFLELYHAAFLGTGVINPLNGRLASTELAHIIADSGTKVMFVHAAFQGLLDQVSSELGTANPLETVVVIAGDNSEGSVGYEELLSASSPSVPPEPEEDDPVVLMYTGGTTGLPKGVLIDHRSEVLNLYHGLHTIRTDESTVALHLTPMFHAASTSAILSVTALGGRGVTTSSFDVATIIDLIETEEVTLTGMVPTMIGLLLNHDSFSAHRLRSLGQLVYGAAPMPAGLLDRLIAELPDLQLIQAYGMTECSSTLTLLGPDDHRRGKPRRSSVGRPVLGMDVSIRDESGEATATGDVGEVYARGGSFMTEYWGQPEQTAEVFRSGWFHTGDAGYLDDDGYLYLVDRLKDMIITGGENVYSAEVESVISTHPAVAQVAVIGIPDDKWGEAVHAVIVLRPDADVSEDDIKDWARASLAGYKVPKSVEIRSVPLPMSGAMKVVKQELRAAHWEP